MVLKESLPEVFTKVPDERQLSVFVVDRFLVCEHERAQAFSFANQAQPNARPQFPGTAGVPLIQ